MIESEKDTIKRYAAQTRDARNLNEKWIERWARQKDIMITRGTQQTEITTRAGIPDYYLPEHRAWIEEKRNIKDTLQPHQMDTCLYLKSLGYRVYIAIRKTGAIIPLTEYIHMIKWRTKYREVFRYD